MMLISRRMPLLTQMLVTLLIIMLAPHVHGQSERAAAIDRKLADRAELIKCEPDNPHLLAEQAAGFYFDYLAVDGAGWITLLGFPNESQRERARTAGRQIDELTRRAQQAVEQEILRLESLPNLADDLELQRERQRLIEEERERRLPFLMAVGAAVRAQTQNHHDAQRQELLERALGQLENLTSRLTGPIAARARMHAGLAASELAHYQKADELLKRVQEAEDVEAIVQFAARLQLASNADGERDLERLAAEPAYARSLFHRLLVADRLFMKRRDRSLANAAQAYGSLLELRFETPAEHARAAILLRLACAAEDIPPADRPPLVVCAMAERALTHGAGDDVAESVRSVLARDVISERERAQAMLTLARIEHASGHHLDAAAHYIQFADEYSAQPIAEHAIALGLSLAGNRYSHAPAESRDVFHRGLNVALSAYPRIADIDRWRFMAARLALHERRFEDAISHVDALSKSHDRWLDGQLIRLEAMQQLANDNVGVSQEEKLFDQIIEVASNLDAHLGGLIASADDEQAIQLRKKSQQLRIHRSAALLASGNAEGAVAALEGIENDPATDSAAFERALTIRIEALQVLSRPEDVRRQLQVFLAKGRPDRASAVAGSTLANVQRRIEELQDRDQNAQAQSIIQLELAPLADLLDAWIHKDDARSDFGLALQVAAAHRTAGKFEESLRLYDLLLREQPNALPLLLGRAEALYHLGIATGEQEQLGQAMTIYRRLIAAGSGRGLYDTYWLAQLRSLQILDATGRNTNQIAPQIQRLRLRDPALGGEQLRPKFERLQNKYAN